MAPKKTASKPQTSTSTNALVKWQEKFAGYAKQATAQTASIGTGGIGVKFGRGTITIGDKQIKDGRLECIIVGGILHNRWFEGEYDADNTAPPNCYSFTVLTGDKEKDDELLQQTKPHPQASDPQSELCSECDKNKWGSGRGKAKACANTIRMGLLLASDCTDGKSALAAEMATAGASPTNQAHYKNYIEMLANEHGCPPWAAVTEIRSFDDPKTQIRIEFKLVDLITDDDILTALEKRYLKVNDQLAQPYSAGGTSEEEKPAKKTVTAGKNRKFAATGKKK